VNPFPLVLASDLSLLPPLCFILLLLLLLFLLLVSLHSTELLLGLGLYSLR
jgi:hypothetical protein